MRGLSAWVLLLILTAVAAPAYADAAARLFYEGVKLVGLGSIENACRKFEQSYNLEPAPGTLFKLSDCHERLGKTASALRGFERVAEAAERAGKPHHEEQARARAAALSPIVSRLSLIIPFEATPDVIRIDGEEVPREQWHEDVPVDPGVVTVSTRSWNRDVIVGKEETITVRVPSPPAEEPVVIEPEASSTPLHAIGALSAMGLGAVGLAIGTGFGIASIAAGDEADALCDAANRCSAKGVALRDDAIAQGDVSTAAFAIGGALFAGGVLWWFVAPSESPNVTVGGRF